MSASLLLLAACIGLDKLPGRDTDPAGSDTSSATVGGLRIDAASIDFGAVELGGTLGRDLLLTNTGDAPVGVDLEIDGDAFEVSTAALTVDTDAVVTVSFAPRTEGPYEGTLTVGVDGGESLDIPLAGIGGEGDTDTDTDADTDTDTEPTGPGPNISVTPNHYDFGRVDTETTETTTFTVSNNGDDDLLISDVVASAGVWVTGGTLSPPQVLAPGSNKLLEVSFTPTAETTYSGTITIRSDDPDTPDKEIAVEGEGVDLCDICSPLIDVDTGGSDPYAITDFFSISALRTTDSRTITIQNVGDMDLTVSSVAVNNDALATCGSFTVGGWRGSTTLAPWDSTTFTISYTATESCLEVSVPELDSNVAHILSNDPSQSDWVIELSGAAL